MKLAELDLTAAFAWSNDCLPLLATGTVAGAVDLNFNSSSSLEIWDIFASSDGDANKPVFKSDVEHRFYALAWSKPFDKRPRGVLAAAFENGSIEFYDAETLVKSKDLAKASIHKSDRHSGPVKALSFNPKEPHILVSGGSKGEIFIWDTKTFAEPTSPGKAMTPMDEVTSVAWNNSVSHIFASTGNSGFTSIWDLKSKREVLHISYNGELGKANFSSVAWHPTQSTKLVTASDNDGCPLILTWDLRNSNAPEKILQGHKKGVLSLDWCIQDPELLISSGKDNTTMLWNPITGTKLGEYPTTANWSFLAKFAPSAPEIIATASFDGKIVIQSLQDTSPPIAAETNKNEDEFWNEISTTDTQQPTFEVKQAPAWLKRPVSVSFGFGSKIVSVTKDSTGKSLVNVTKFITKSQGSSERINKALESNSFKDIIDEKVAGKFIDDKDKKDWELLQKLSSSDKKSLFVDAIKDEEEVKAVDTTETKADSDDIKPKDESDFFDNLGERNGTKEDTFVPTGSFKLFGSSGDSDKQLIKLVLSNQIEKAVDECLSKDKLVEALILALDAPESIKTKAKNAYFSKEYSEISRVLYGAASKNITDIVGNADVSDWKHIASGIASYCDNVDDYNSKITELGDRLLEADNAENRDNAILCYLAGGAIDKISNIWLKELPDFEAKLLSDSDNKEISSPFEARFESLNNFAEKLVTYRSISNLSGTLSGPSIEPICKTILEYANLLAGSGQFSLAERFLKLLPEDFAGSKTDKERIDKASGISQTTTASKTVKANGRVGQYSRASQPSVPKAKVASPLDQFAQPLAPGFAPPITKAPPVLPLGPGAQFTAATPLAPSTPLIPSAPKSHNPYIKPAANQYAPQTTTPAPAANPYAPPASNPYAAPTNPYLRNSTPASPPVPSQPPKPKYKEVTDGWNDLPETFKQKSDSRRAAAAVISPAPTPQPSAIPKRPSVVSPAAPPSAPPVGPPRPLSRTASKASLPNASSASSPRPVQSHISTRYAPPLGSVAPPAPPSIPSAIGSPKQVPKNPYAPSGNGYSSVVSPPVAPPSSILTNPSMAPTPAPFAPQAPVSNPYAPPPPVSGGPIRNSYAPPPSSGANSRVHSGGLVPPKPTIQPPPVASNSISSLYVPPPPPPGGAAYSQPPSKVPEPVEPEKEVYPAGDRSHIPDDSKPIYDIFNSILENIKPNIPERFIKHGEDMEKRLNILFDHLNNDDLLTKDGINALKQVATTLDAKDYQTAASSILSFASSFPDETGHWHIGVKRLVNMAEALQSDES